MVRGKRVDRRVVGRRAVVVRRIDPEAGLASRNLRQRQVAGRAESHLELADRTGLPAVAADRSHTGVEERHTEVVVAVGSLAGDSRTGRIEARVNRSIRTSCNA